MSEKACPKCTVTKSDTDFHKDKSQPDGLTTQCKECRGKASKAWQEANKDRVKLNNQRWLAEHPGYNTEKLRRYRAKDPERFREHGRKSYRKNAEKCKAYQREKNKSRKEEISRYHKEYRLKNLEKKRAYDRSRMGRWRDVPLELRRARVVKYAYGLSSDAYQALIDSQGNCCAICGTAGTAEKVLRVDHYHSSEKESTPLIRGLLCDSCNTGIGKFRDSAALIQLAVDYLNRPSTTVAIAKQGTKARRLQRESLIAQQNGSCAICTTRERIGMKLDVDHVHNESQFIRGLLCRPCNLGLGSLRDSILLLQSAIAYLTKHAQ